MKQIIFSFLAAAFIAVLLPLLILKFFAPDENAASTEPVPPVSAETESPVPAPL